MTPEEDVEELTAREVAEAFEVHPVTVARWRHGFKGVPGNTAICLTPARKPRRGPSSSGYRYRVTDVLAFARQIDDDGQTEAQFLDWWRKRHPEEDIAS